MRERKRNAKYGEAESKECSKNEEYEQIKREEMNSGKGQQRYQEHEEHEPGEGDKEVKNKRNKKRRIGKR